MVLYMAVTCDKFEMPLYVTESRKDIASFLGIPPDTVSCLCAKNAHKAPPPWSASKHIRVRRVVVDEMEDDEL